MPFFFQLKWLLADKEHENKLLKEKYSSAVYDLADMQEQLDE